MVHHLRFQSVKVQGWRENISQLWLQEHEVVLSHLNRTEKRKHGQNNMGRVHNSQGLPYSCHLSLDKLRLLKALQSPQIVQPGEGRTCRCVPIGSISYSSHDQYHMPICCINRQQWSSYNRYKQMKFACREYS